MATELYDIGEDEVSHSKLAAWNRCRYSYHLQHERGIVPRLDRPAIRIGSAVHAGLASALSSFETRTVVERRDSVGQVVIAQLSNTPTDNGLLGVNTWAKAIRDLVPDLTDEERADLLETELVACGIVSRTVRELDLGHKWMTVRLNGSPLVEYKLSIPFRDRIGRLRRIGLFKRFRGVIDWIARELSNGSIWLIDHKCYSSFQPVEHEEVNVQMATYQFLMQAHGIEACGSICHQIRPELPKEPKRNKDGSMSRADCLTDWPTYQDALRRAGLNPEHYAEMKEKLDEKEWWRMSRAYRSTSEVRATFQQATMPGVREVARRGPRYRTMGTMTCNGCFVKDYCLEELRGGDTEFLMRTKYRHKSEPAIYTFPVLEE